MKQCEKCNKWLSANKFFQREDRPGLYSWCNFCMEEQMRTPNYPSLKYRNPSVYEQEYWRRNAIS